MSKPVTTVLAFDYGSKRLGVAVGQDLSATATALKTLKIDNGRIDWPAVSALVDEWRPDEFVVGKPDYADNNLHPLRASIERFARQLNGRFQRPVSFIDERLSSYAAAEDTTASQRAGLDAVSACHILESWLAEKTTT